MATLYDDLNSIYAYNRWADARMVDALRTLTPEAYAREPFPGWSSVRSTVVHMGDGMTIWARRLSGETVTGRRHEDDVPTLDDAERLLREAHDVFEQQLFGMTRETLDTVWFYRNFQGVACALPLWAVFRHVANHATYHRGQVASKIRLLGGEPPSTDLVQWAIAETPQPE